MAIILNGLFSEGAALSAINAIQTNGTNLIPAQAVANHCALVPDPLGGTFNCAKLSLLATDVTTNGGYRTEFSSVEDAIGSEYWYHVPFLLPADWRFVAGANYLVVQVHNIPDVGDTAVCGPPVALVVTGDGKMKVEISFDANANTTVCVPSQTYVQMCSWDATPGKWDEFTARIKWAYDNTGILQLFRKRRLIFSRVNQPNCYNDAAGNYLKFGPYGPFYGVNIDRHIYYKGVRVCNSTGSFVEVTGTTQLETVSAVNAALL